jgi:hypothetical protein
VLLYEGPASVLVTPCPDGQGVVREPIVVFGAGAREHVGGTEP